MVCWNFGRRCLVSTVAAVPAVALSLFGLSAPALAHARYATSAHYHYPARYLARREVISGAADSFASGMNGYAATSQWTPQSRLSHNAWGQDNWQQRQSSWAPPAQSGALDGMAGAAASEAGVPLSLVQRVIGRESGGNPRALSRGNYGLMQIRLGTARAMGYSGSAAGLLDPQTNLTYAVRYLAGAYRAAGGNESRAVALYARGYYAQARTQGFSPYAPGTGFGQYDAMSRPRAFVRDPEVAEATAGPLYAYAVPVRRLRYYRHRAG
jgi:soluble lytic murein transglycosylase-like protein